MKKHCQKALALLLCLCLCAGLSPAVMAEGDAALTLSDSERYDAYGGLIVNATNFPDAIFRGYVAKNYDTDGDLVLTAAEREAVTEMDVHGLGIESMVGVCEFPNLVTLNCSENRLRELNVSDLPLLERLYCQSNLISAAGEGLELLIPGYGLKVLWCYSNRLTGENLNLGMCPGLEYLDCSNNPLSSLNLNLVPELRVLHCNNAGLPEIDLSPVPKLSVLWCWSDGGSNGNGWNSFEELDLSACPKLADVVVNGNVEKYLFHVAFFVDDVDEIDIQDVSVTTLVPLTLHLGGEYDDLVLNPMPTPPEDEPVSAAESVPLDEAHFPDENFRRSLARFDNDRDGILSEDELKITSLNLNSDNIASLKGIEYFTNLKSLNCGYNQLTSLDLNGLEHLTSLNCGNNRLTSLDLNGLEHLTSLGCYGNELTSLVLSNLENLESLDCRSNQLTSLDLSDLKNLTSFYCYNNQLTSLELSSNKSLTSLGLSGNPLESLTLRDCIKQQRLTLNNIETLRTLNIINCPALTSLDCSGCQLTSLNLSGCTALETLNCQNNQLPALSLDGCAALGTLRCDGNRLTALHLNPCEKLTSLNCENNQLESLRLDSCAALTSLSCGKNRLSGLELSGCDGLEKLSCADNRFTSLNLSAYPALTSLDCSGNSLSALELGCCPAITSLNCSDNPLNALDVSGNERLTSLLCNSIGISALDLSHNDRLITLQCGKNRLSELDVSMCPRLNTLLVLGNPLPTLDISCNDNLLRTYTEGEKTENELAELYSYTVNVDYPVPTSSISSTSMKVVSVLSFSKPCSIVTDAAYTGPFPDPAFRALLLEIVDADRDGNLSDAELKAVTELDVSGKGIRDLSGIERFTQLRVLNCSENRLSSLDVSGLQHLEALYCQANYDKLDISFMGIEPAPYGLSTSSSSVYDLPVTSGGLSSLTVGSAPLRVLWCYDNNLRALDLSACTTLENLDCAYNLLRELDVSDMPALTTLMCHDNELESLDLSHNPALRYLWCWNNPMEELDISVCPELSAAADGSVEFCTDHVSLFTNDAEVGVSPYLALYRGGSEVGVPIDSAVFPDREFRFYIRVMADKNYDGVLSDAELDALDMIDCSGWQISSLEGVNTLRALKILRCRSNGLSELDVSGLKELIELDCSYNKLVSLNVKGATELVRLRATDNALTALDLSENEKLRALWCWNNSLEALDLRRCPTLSGLFLNGITESYYASYEDSYYDDDGVYHEVITGGYVSYFNKSGTGDLSIDRSLIEGVEAEMYVAVSSENFPDAEFYRVAKDLDTDGNGILNRAEIEAVEELDCSDKGIETLKGIEFFTRLKKLDCSGNSLELLPLAQLTALEELDCSDNRLTALDASRNPGLFTLNCADNRITALTLSNNYALRRLDCGGNPLTALELKDCNILSEAVGAGRDRIFRDDDTLRVSTTYDDPIYGVIDVYLRVPSAAFISLALPAADCVMPARVRRIEQEAFMGCTFYAIRLNEGLVSIGPRAFAESGKLHSVYIPASVTDIADNAFEWVDDFVLLGRSGSAAETFANRHGIVFFAISE